MEVKKGYKQTEVGVIPEDWELCRLGDKTLKIGSGITPTGGEKVYKKEGRPFLRSQNIGWGNLSLDDMAYITDETHETFKATEIENNDIFLNITGASIGRSSVADSRVTGGNVNQHVCIIRTNQKEVFPIYLNHFLLSKNGQKQIDSFQAGGNRQGLNFGQIASFRIPLPPLPEQRAIAEALGDVDALLGSLEKLIAKKRALKQAAMQELLTGKKRLPGFSGDWEVKRLGDIGTTYGGLTGKTKDDFGTGYAKYIPFLNVMNNVVVNLNQLESVYINTNENQNAVIKGDLLFNGSSETPREVGMCSVFSADISGLYLNSFCFGFRFHNIELSCGLYMAYFFRSNEGRNVLFSLAQGATRYNLSKRAFLAARFSLPSLPEQKAIATVLSDMDTEIKALEKRLEKTRVLKQGMMQELLTGSTRLTNN